MSELTREQIAKEASLHSRFSENDINNYWTVRAEAYARQYNGNFAFMLDMKKKVDSGFTPAQVKAILNCARKEGTDNSTPVIHVADHGTPVGASKELVVDFDFDKFEEAVQETMSVSPEQQELAEINKRILDIQSRMNSIRASVDPLQGVIEKSQADEVELFQEFERQIQEIRSNRRDAEIAVQTMNAELLQIQEELEAQQRLHALTLQNIAAQQLFNETKKQFEELREGMVWDDKIMDFQWDDVCFMAAAFLANKSGVLNANDMGLGKTAETSFLLDIIIPLFYQKYNRLPLILWLTKKTLRYSTFKELTKWNPDRKPIVIEGTAEARKFAVELAVATNSMVIANYDMMNTTPTIMRVDWDIVIMDEVHKLKGGANSTPTKIFENALSLLHDKHGQPKPDKFFIPLSGSPIQNHPKEMWTYLHLFDPTRFPNVRHFERNFCFGWGEKDDWGNPIVQVDWERIIRAMKDRVIRHSKQEVLKDLPDKTREFRYVELTGEQLDVYRQLRDDFFVWLDGQKEQKLNATSILAQLTRLRQAAIIPASIGFKDAEGFQHNVDVHESAKIDEAMDIVEQLVGAGEQVVVFSSQFNPPLEEMAKRIANEGWTSRIMNGATSNQFQQIEQDFQDKKFDVLLVNSKTGGEGLNLQKSDDWEGGANHAIFLDLWWNPESNKQAEDRLHRTGQKDAVTIHIIQAENTVDQFIAAKLEEKENMIQGIMEDSDFRKGSDWAEVLSGLL